VGWWFDPGMRDQLTRIGKRFVQEIQRDDASGISAELAYRFLFAIFPFGIFVAALSAFVAQAAGIEDPTSKIIGALSDNLPPDVANAIAPQIEAVIGTTRPGLLTFGALLALWSASSGTQALMKAMNRAYEVEETRSLVPKYALSIGLTLLATIGILVAFVTVVGASLLTQEVTQRLGFNQQMIDLIGLLRWPFVFLLLAFAVGVLYKLAPNIRVPFKWCLLGGAIFAVGWLIATGVFGLYVANFANYANTYGALGGVIILMLWFYISSFVLVASAAFIAAVLKEIRPAVVDEARTKRTPKAGSESADAPNAPEPARAPRAVAPARDARPIPAAAVEVAAARDAARPARRAPRGWTSGPEDWAVAGTVTGIGVSLGVIAAWLVGHRTRG
jgi:membrane protein